MYYNSLNILLQTGAGASSGGFYSTQTLVIVASIALMLILISVLLFRVKYMLRKMAAEKRPDDFELSEPSFYEGKVLPFWQERNRTVTAVIIGTLVTVVLGACYFIYANEEIGVQQGYAPKQPIAYSHALHAGKYKIDCQYCHSTASFSKQASVPSVSTCMNCHSYIDAKDKYDGEVSPEIQKIRDAYKNKTPIKWVRIHNLPDYAYFNHSQHVGVAGLECQTCHGAIETMEVVRQEATLQMGWCINCHREAKVDVANNDYYEQLHKEMDGMGRKSITVAKNGGLECGKCHY